MMTVLDSLKIKDLRSMVQKIDPGAFIIFCEANEVFGEGFAQPFQPASSKKTISSSTI
jgi:uncharacterized membrane-anchored protein YitT (DUF2179 family)